MHQETLFEVVSGIVDQTADSTLLNNNANKAAERIPVMKNMIAGEVAKAMAHQYVEPAVIAAHGRGEIHFHDKDESPLLPFYNCAIIDVGKMLSRGFTMGNADIETPKSIQTACALVAQIIAQVACHQYGGVSLNRLDEVLVPYVSASYAKHLSRGKAITSHDKAVVYATQMTEEEVMNACQGLEYEVNTLFTSQGQTPFVTFGFGLGTSWQARLIQKGILKTRIKGLGRQGRTAIFPKLVYLLEDNVNVKAGDVNYDIRKLAINCAAERNYPDIVSMPMLRANGGGCTPMGCRSFPHKWINEEGVEQWEGRNNLGVVSINLPRIAIESAGDLDIFNEILQERLQVAKAGLFNRIDRLRGVKAKVAPILYCTGALGKVLDPEDDIMQVFDNGQASISLGYIGIHETVQALLGDSTSPVKDEAKQILGNSIVNTLHKAAQEWKRDTGWAFSVYSTPSESLCDRFCRLDREEFGIIKGVTDHEYYTNSFHLDVREQVSPFTKLDFEKEYHKSAPGGNISFSELPNVDLGNRTIMIETLWDYAYTRVPYYGTNCCIDFCHECNTGIDSVATEKGFSCPICGNVDPKTLEVTKRVCGYLGAPPVRPFIHGKQTELINRKKHK